MLKKDAELHLKIGKELKELAKKYAQHDNRTLSGFVAESIRERIERMARMNG